MLFEVSSRNLSDLTPDKSVELIRKLVWADATASGIGRNLINIPTAITVKDDGIDGEVTQAEKNGRYGIIKKGLTRYQIKSGNFRAHDSDIDSILLKKSSSKPELKDRIKS